MDEFEIDWDAIAIVVEAETAKFCGDRTVELTEVTSHLLKTGVLDNIGIPDEIEDPADVAEYLVDEVREMLTYAAGIWTTPDDRVLLLSRLIERIIFTHRLTEEEIAAETVEATVDFLPITFDLLPETESRLKLTTGGPIDTDATWPKESSHHQIFWKGPKGWLSEFKPGDLLGLKRIGTKLELSKPTSTRPADEAAQRFSEKYESIGMQDGNEETDFFIIDTLCEHAEEFIGANAPFSEILDAAGLAVREAWIGKKGSTWQTPSEISRNQLFDEVLERFELSPCCAKSLKTMLAVFDASQVIDQDELAKAVEHEDALTAFEFIASHTFLSTNPYKDLVQQLADQPDTAPWALHYLQGMSFERESLPLDAHAEFLKAYSERPNAEPVVWKVIETTGDSGDAAGVKHLYESVGAQSHHEYSLLREMLTDPKGVKRNDPCVCGSGRKFKACCQGKPNPTEKQRHAWLKFRIGRHFFKSGGRNQISAMNTITEEIEELDPHDLDHLATFAVFEGGGLQKYVEERGALFDELDRRTTESWLSSQRCLYEVTGITRGISVVLRDTKSGDSTVVKDRRLSENVDKGDYLLARIVEENNQNVIYSNPISVPPRKVQDTLELIDSGLTSLKLAIWYASLFDLPTITNSDGELFELCTAEIAIEDINDNEIIEATLDEFFSKNSESNTWTWLDDSSTVLGTITFERQTLHLETNSTDRLASLMLELEDVGLNHEVTNVQIKSFEEMLAERES